MRFHLLHIGKTGGSALRQALTSSSICKDVIVHGHDVTLRDVPIGEQVVFAVRDPVSRFVSGFNSRLRKGRPRYNSEWSEAEAKVFARFATPKALADALSSEASDARAAAEAALESIGHLSRHLTYWLESAAYIKSRREDILFIALTQALDSDSASLGRLLGLSSTLIPPGDLVGRHATPPGFETELSPEGSKAIGKWYARDAPLYEACLALRTSILEA